jgi:hypothetical protein
MCVAPPGRDQRGVQVHTDREASDEDGRPGPTTPHEPSTAHEYGYGEEDGGVPVDPYGAPAPGVPGPQGAGPDDLSPTERRSVTGVQGVTAPRAMLRPVPEGFPTPPPRPARPNRRPAKGPDPAGEKGPRRGLLMAAIAVAAVLVLAIAIGGGILAVRALSSDGPEATAGTGEASQDPAPGGTAEIGELRIEAIGTEAGVRSVGTRGNPVEPEGEFVIVTVELSNAGDRPLTLSEDTVALETADGERHVLDRDASRTHTADSEPPGLVRGDDTVRVHLVYDVPIGSEASALQFDFGDYGSGTLPLGA